MRPPGQEVAPSAPCHSTLDSAFADGGHLRPPGQEVAARVSCHSTLDSAFADGGRSRPPGHEFAPCAPCHSALDGQDVPVPCLTRFAAEFEPMSAPAHASALVLFSGDYLRPDGLIPMLQRWDLSVTALDIASCAQHDFLDAAVYSHLQQRVRAQEFKVIFAAPPCSTFSYARFVRSRSSADGGPPIIRRRSNGQVMGTHDCPEAHRRELQEANDIVSRLCTLLQEASALGMDFVIENPADRGDANKQNQFEDKEHAPLWIMPDILALERRASCQHATFPQCAFKAPYRKETTLSFTLGLAAALRPLDALFCTHESHKKNSWRGGRAVVVRLTLLSPPFPC